MSLRSPHPNFLHLYLFSLICSSSYHHHPTTSLISTPVGSSEDKAESVPLSTQCHLTQWKYLTAHYWHGVSHHPGSAQLPGHCFCGLCVSSSCTGTPCIWSPENRRAHLLPKSTFFLLLVSIQVFFFWFIIVQTRILEMWFILCIYKYACAVTLPLSLSHTFLIKD